MIDIQKFRAQLARRAMPQWRFALRLNLRPSTFSDYIRGRCPCPPNLESRIEKALRLEPGALTSGRISSGATGARTRTRKRAA
jgi:hypothetical protein